MIEKGIILAGGTGSRLNNLTRVTNKHLLPVYNDPMIYYPLRTLINAAIKDIMIVSGRSHAGHFLELLGSGEEFGVNLSYTVQESPSGIAGALRLCKRFANEDNIAVILGDNIYEDKFDFSDFREGARVYLKRSLNPQRFGVGRIRTDTRIDTIPLYKDRKGKLIEIVEKPKIDTVDHELIDKNGYGFIVTGLYLYPNDVFDKISCLKPSARGELEITDINNMYIRENRMDSEIVTGFWSDMGTPESLYNASSFIRNKITQ
jgi:glucose-1-phosphate thymidylyltransferase